MSTQTYMRITGALFAVIAIIHLIRLVIGWEAQIGGWSVPLWASWVFLAITGFLATSAFYLNKNPPLNQKSKECFLSVLPPER